MNDEAHHIARQAAALDDPRLCRDSGGVTDAQDEAPERIWLQEPVGLEYERTWCAEQQSDNDTPYVRADLARPSQAGDERVARMVEAARAVADGAFDTYRAANGRQVGIQADDGEKCEIVHSNLLHGLRAALAAMDTPKGGGDE